MFQRRKYFPKKLPKKSIDLLNTAFSDDNAFDDKPTTVPLFAGKNAARFMKILREQGVTVSMQHMKG